MDVTVEIRLQEDYAFQPEHSLPFSASFPHSSLPLSLRTLSGGSHSLRVERPTRHDKEPTSAVQSL